MYMLLYLKQKTNEDENIKKKNSVRKSPVNRNLNQTELGNQKGELSRPEITAEPKMKTDSANEKLLLVFTPALPLPFPSIKVFTFPFCVETCLWLIREADLKLQFSVAPK